MLKQIFRKYLPPHWHGIAIDGTFILLNLTVLSFLGSYLQGLFRDSFKDDAFALFIIGLIFIIIYIWRFVALYLKRIPLKQRAFLDETYTTEDGLDTPAYIWVLSLATALVSGVFVILAITTFLKSIGVGDFTVYIAYVALIIPVIEIWLIFRLFKKPTKKELKKLRQKRLIPKEPINKNTQLFAELGLFVYIFVWQAVYNVFISAMFTGYLFASVGVFIFFTIICLVTFVMLYLGPRSVFLFEDAKYKITWVSILLVFLSSYIPQILSLIYV